MAVKPEIERWTRVVRLEVNARQHPHLDYGYAVTSHSSQGQTRRPEC